MLDTLPAGPVYSHLAHAAASGFSSGRCRVVVIWIDWYAYHIARFRWASSSNPDLAGSVVGIELVGGIGVHAGLRFREELAARAPRGLTLFPEQQLGRCRAAA